MKLSFFLLLVLIAIVAHAQPPRPQGSVAGGGGGGDNIRDCPGEPRGQNCRERQDEGRRGPNCQERAGTRWYYSTSERRCQTLQYLGCGGNGNRYCNRRDCEEFCERRGGGGSGSGNTGRI